MRLAWLTDIHLDFLDEAATGRFLGEVAAIEADAVLVGGDIALARTVVDLLRRIEAAARAPVHFVLGNHDFYGGSIARVRAEVRAASRGGLRWLSESGPISLTAGTALVGHDGWADGRYGDYAGSTVLLSDFRLIADFWSLDAADRLALLQRLAGEAADHLAAVVPAALERHRRVIVLTHVPPFDAAAWHEGKMSEPDFLPFFASKAAGDVLREAMLRRPDREMLVLCGHTHGSGEVQVLPNLRVRTGGADYGRPAILDPIDIEGP